jgi:hypothetical protein
MATPPRRRAHARHQRVVGSARGPRGVVAVERLWSRLGDLLAGRSTAPPIPTFTLSPRRLEQRRMLDAAGGALALETVAVATALASTDEGTGNSPEANLYGNTPPSNIEIQTPIVIQENGVATLSLTFDDPDSLDAHTVEIDWNDGTTEIFTLAPGETSFSTTHQYLEDNDSGAIGNDYDVQIRVVDAAGEADEATAQITVQNVAPSNLQIEPIAPINENGVATLQLSFDDPGSLDEHTVEIDWGDGTAVEVFTLPAGERTLTATHQYLDDAPSGTPSDEYAIQVRVVDDEFGETTAAAVAKVANVAPGNVLVKPVANILDEGGQVALTVTFDDQGTQDTHQVEINWGDGNVTVTNVVGNSLQINHIYGDNATYAIIVKVVDDDGGAGFDSAAALVKNVPPSNVQTEPIAPIDENGVALLKLTFDDPGSLDSHTVEVDWGDGTVETIAVAAGSRTFVASHQYRDDNPSGTAADNYTVSVKVRDDDGGQATGSAVAKVLNVPPSNVVVTPVATITTEGTQINLSVNFQDPGTEDTHVVEINWGDGNVTVASAVGHSLAASHTYGDNGTYAIIVKVVDDDGGEGFGSAATFVANVAPSNVKIEPIAAIDENGMATLTLSFDDPGTLDSHTVEVDWGDGTVETIAVAAGSRTLTATHQYLDDNPTATTADVYAINVIVRDDDGGEAAGSATIEVKNVAPDNVDVDPVANIIQEGGGVTLVVTFDDPGSQDTHEVEITWGDGHVTTGTATGHTFTASHVYADNGTYAVYVKVIDDDGGVGNGSAAVFVANVKPSVTVVGPQTVNEGAVLSLDVLAEFADPGFDNPLNAGNILNGGETTENFTYTISWGDGTAAESGAVTNVQSGGPGTLTTGSIAGSHVYADNGVYTVTVTIADDDGGVTTKTFEVTVNNVDPTLTFANPTIVVNEGAPITLAGLGVGASDPGFKNNALGTDETFEGATVDWGDGSTPDNLSVSVGSVGGVGAPTTGVFSHDAHHYADNGTYAVTVRFKDDDGQFVERTFTIVVENVAPSLQLTDRTLEINEGDTLDLFDLATFEDPGFDNPANPNGPSVETFTYVIDWGDNSTPTTGTATIDQLGSAGFLTKGSFKGEHQYLDNDGDNLYTIIVTLTDDDGGTVTKTLQVTVKNVRPEITHISATDVNSSGETTLTIEFADPGADDFWFDVDWGDGKPFDPVMVQQGARSFQYTYKYDGPPNNSAADIPITVTVFDDDFDLAGVVDNRASEPATIEISQPGLGAEKFRIDTTPQVAILTFPDRQVVPLLQTAPENRIVVTSTTDDGGGGGDSRAASERYLELIVVNPDGTDGPGYRLPSQMLDNLPALFRNLPDNHYKIYLVQSETNARRLVIEVFVRNGKLIDPGDDSEGARDRPPTEESTTQPTAEPSRQDEEAPLPAESADAEALLPSAPAHDTPIRSSTAIYHSATLAGVALALSGAGKSSCREINEALSRAKPEEWKRLRAGASVPRKKPR